MKAKKTHLFLLAVMVISLGTFVAPLHKAVAANTYNWQGGYGSNEWNYYTWYEGYANWGLWNYSFPSSTDTVNIGSSTSSMTSSKTANYNYDGSGFYLGDLNITGRKRSGGSIYTATLNLQSGTLQSTTVDLNNYGYLTQTGGTLNATTFNISGGAYSLTGGSLNAGTIALTSGSYYQASPGTAKVTTTFNQSGGTSTFGTLNVDNGANYIKKYELSGGDLSATTVNLSDGTFKKTGGTLTYTTFNQSGGTADFTSGGLSNAGLYNLSGGYLNAASLANSGSFKYTGGSLNTNSFTNSGTFTGAGTVNPYSTGSVTFTNSGTLNPGNSPGTLTITGNYNQTSAGTLVIELASNTLYDVLNITGTATLAGILKVILLDGYMPDTNQYYDILIAKGGLSGIFENYDLPALAAGKWYVLRLDLLDSDGNPGTDGVLDTVRLATPIPPAAWLLATGLLGLVGVRRRFTR